MAHYGGQISPRVHRPRAPIMSAPPPLTAPLAPLQRPQPPVTLTAPRPENERAANEYVETPFRQSNKPPTPPPLPPQPPRHQRPTRLPLPTPPLPAQLPQPPPPPPIPTTAITKQPPAIASFSKDPTSATITSTTTTAATATTITTLSSATAFGLAECAARPSIVCPQCSRCRCESCQQPRPLPQRWVCNDSCLLSADSIIDYASCLCCVKGLFYHCSESDGGESCADNPCGCGPDRRKARWGCLGALSFVLPCLWLYWPLQGCKHAVEVCYARHSRTGCRCRPPLATPEKRLLDSSPDF